MRAMRPLLSKSALTRALTVALAATFLAPAGLSAASPGKGRGADDAGPPGWQQSAAKNKSGKGQKQERHMDALSYRYVIYTDRGGPPPWAPAHGYRRKFGSGEPVITADIEPIHPPFVRDGGFCERDVIGAILGGAAGAAIGSQIGKGDGRTVAIVGGAVLGVIVGGVIGRAMDESDQTCVGQALEYLPDGEDLVWTGETRKARYQVTPLATYEDNRGRFCREFVTTADLGGADELAKGVACRLDDGAWQVLR